MNAQDLRIGNLIERTFDGKSSGPEQVTVRTIWDIFQIQNGTTGSFVFMPIPITGEWLIRAGFDNEDETTWRHKNGHHITETIKGTVYRVPGVSLAYIQYVHQLQNLYFALTNKELIIV